MAEPRDRCHQTDLLMAECAHCRPMPSTVAGAAVPAGLEDLVFGRSSDDVGPIFMASYYSDCPECWEKVEPGDEARMVDGEAVHARCA